MKEFEENVKRIEVLDTTEHDVSIAIWFKDGTKQIIVMTRKVAEDLIKAFGGESN